MYVQGGLLQEPKNNKCDQDPGGSGFSHVRPGARRSRKTTRSFVTESGAREGPGLFFVVVHRGSSM